MRLVASPEGTNGSVTLHADASLYAGLLDGAQEAHLALNPQRKGYVFLVRGELLVNGLQLVAGDAALLDQESMVSLTQGLDAEVLVFDLAA